MQSRHNTASVINRLVVGAARNVDLHALLRDTTGTLSNLDFEHRHELQRLETSKTDPALKKQIAHSLSRKHRERRQPYVKLITELQKQLASGTPAHLDAVS